VTALLLAVLAQAAAAPLDRAADFARSLEAAVAKGDTLALDLALDPDAFYGRVVGKTVLSPGINDFLKPMARLSFASTPIFAVLQPPVAWKFLRVRQADDGIRALFRMTGKGAGFNYQELLLVDDPAGFRIIDYFVLNFGGFQSELARRSIMPSPEALQVLNILKAPTAGDFMQDYMENPLNQLSRLFSAGEHAKVLDLYYSKPDFFGKIRIAQVLHINAARNIDAAAHQKAVDEMEAAFKDDPAVAIASIGGHTMHHEKDKALAAIDRVDKAVGGDLFLNVTRANLYFECKDAAKARELAKLVTEKEPSLSHGWWTLIGMQLSEKDYKGVAASLTGAEKNLGLHFENLDEIEIYADFAKSPEYAEWMKGRKPK
jgi:hypothetical protein